MSFRTAYKLGDFYIPLGMPYRSAGEAQDLADASLRAYPHRLVVVILDANADLPPPTAEERV